MDTTKHSFSDDDYKHIGIKPSSSIPINQSPIKSPKSHAIKCSDNTSNTGDLNPTSENKNIIDLQPLSLKQRQIVESCLFLSDRNILQIKFSNSKYDGKTILLSTNLVRSDWNKFTNICRKTLEQRGIEMEDVGMILNTVDSNFDLILQANTSISTNPSNENNHPTFKSLSDRLLDVATESITCKFVDQYNEAFVQVDIDNDHFEIMSIGSRKFARFLSKIYFEKYNGQVVNREAINTVIDTLQAQAEFGKARYHLSLRVAEYDGDFYYDLTDYKQRCIKISKKVEKWEILDNTPVPLFRRYNQISQEVFSEDEYAKNKQEDDFVKIKSCTKGKDPLDEFLSQMTNIKQDDDGTKLLLKVALISYFIPNIPHPIMILHGSAGSAKSTLQYLLKNIVDPAKPSLLTLHNNSSEFIQQLAHNYLATYDNLKYTPYWLADEVCKAVTGVGQTKRLLYTDDEDKVYEYKHCLIFNGINVAFIEPDVLDRSIVIHLDEIDDKKRKTEKEILKEFYIIKPFILRFIFDTLSKAIIIKDKILENTKQLPRMADFAIWGEAILQAWGYKEDKFLNVYFESIGRQNDEVIDSNPIAFVIRKLVEEESISLSPSSSSDPIFEGTPMEFLDELNRIAVVYKINTFSKEWPKDVRWLIRRVNMIKSNLHKALDIRISITRDPSDNTSKIYVTRNISGVSSNGNLSPDSNSLSPYFDNLSPKDGSLTPEINQDLSTKSNDSGDTGDIGDISNTNSAKDSANRIKEREPDFADNSKNPIDSLDTDIGQQQHSRDPNILYDSKTGFYSCKQHSSVMNIHYDEIVRHRKLSASHHSADDDDGKVNDNNDSGI
ncbi:MAG: hypothetical protein R2685_17345 [Candidatus Nitrosocosmicus sp.]|nr:hypothetical protein [Candidatus Nitrosocosmicus sp.]